MTWMGIRLSSGSRPQSPKGLPPHLVSCFRYFKNLAHSLWGKAFFRKLALALQRQLERVRKIRFGLFDGFTLRNRGGKLFHKTSIATLFGGFKNGCQFHARRLSHLRMACGRGNGAEGGKPGDTRVIFCYFPHRFRDFLV